MTPRLPDAAEPVIVACHVHPNVIPWRTQPVRAAPPLPD
jgi:hypothetical protein